jgi:hypothetical protein
MECCINDVISIYIIRAIKNGQSRDTGNIGYTRHRTKTNKTRGHQEWTIQRHWQHWVHKTQDKDKQNKGPSRMDNPETLATLDTQDTGQRQIKQGAIKNGQSRDTGNIGHTKHRTKTNKTQKTKMMTFHKPGVNLAQSVSLVQNICLFCCFWNNLHRVRSYSKDWKS